MRHLAVVLATLLAPAAARADMVPDGYKAVKLSIRVEAAIPAGKALVLANTFEGGTVIAPGTDQPISWHPLGGDMQLRVVPADKVEAIQTAAKARDRDTIKPIVEAGLACGQSFTGVRTIADTSPAVEVRWTYRASVAGEACTADLLKQEYLDATGKAVEAPPPPPEDHGPKPAPLAGPPATPPAPPSPPAPAKTPDGPPVPTAPKSGCGCDAGEPAPGAFAWLGLALLALRRRRG
jgi:MYXO-CTERM domain-containing protein